MKVAQWLAEREPRPPDSLARRMRAVLAHGDNGAASSSVEVSEALLAAAETVLARLLREGCATRESALDLLVADAFVTYAFEAAAAEPGRIVERTEGAMARIAALAGPRPAAAVASSIGPGGGAP